METVGERIKALRKKIGYTQSQLAEKIGVERVSIARYESDIFLPSNKQLPLLASALQCSTDYLLGHNATFMPTAKETSTSGIWVPVLGRVAAGIPIESITDITDYEEISSEMAAHGEHFGLKIQGHSMEPRICEGDIVIVRQQEDVENGEVAVVTVNGNEATVKKIKKRPEGILLIPLNPAYDTMFYSVEEVSTLPVRIIGKVVELRGKF